ncbi:MAG TPA: RIO1 family regulatory kinase/ATPase [Trueperaceae bacterium]
MDTQYADDYLDNEESFSRRHDRRPPRGRQRLSDLVAQEATAEESGSSSEARFTDPELQHLFEISKIDELLGEVKSGKEATVYLVSGPDGLMAAKAYADLRVRSFRNDEVYRRGRWIGDSRIEKAITQRTAKGLEAQQDLWVFHEYLQLWQLFEAGLPVPKPMIGPDKIDLGDAGRVVLMEYIGDDEGPAPRLSDIRLPAVEALSAFEQSVEFARRLHALGKVHGDLSTYNLLWWRERVVAIDFPQMVDAADNPEAGELLERDVANLCRSFRKLGVRADPTATLRRVKGGIVRPGS